MKLTIIGGGGIRTPLAIPPILRRAERLDLEELCLMDINEEKLKFFGRLSREQIKSVGNPFKISLTKDARSALKGADFVITTIRVGDDYGRVLDERIALRHGILGQAVSRWL
jgi:6-phospho-beta-glucosidase